MQVFDAEYVCAVQFDKALPDERAWRSELAEIGLGLEAFSLSLSPSGKTLLRFWEPDRSEALRILAKVNALHASPRS